MKFREVRWSLVVKAVWLAGCIEIWEMGLGSCLVQPRCSIARDGMLPFLYLLSFPSSLLLVMFNGFLVDVGMAVDVLPPLEYTFLAIGSIVLGYLQWFHLVPALFGNRNLTMLSLAKSETIPLSKLEPVQDQVRMQTLSSVQIPAFDEAGRSPLERAIAKRRRRKLTSVS